jgi:hypothetical protein
MLASGAATRRECAVKSLTGLAVAAAFAATACAREATQPDRGGATPQQAQVGDTISLRAGDMARIGTSDVVVAFRRIEADSRCPIDALCVWAGDAAVRIELTNDRRTWSPATLHSFLDPKAVDFSGYTFRLLEVAPPNVSTKRTRPEDYVIALEVQLR